MRDVGRLLFVVLSFVFLSGASILDFGGGQYGLKVGLESPVEKMVLEEEWHREARRLCGHRDYRFEWDDVEVSDRVAPRLSIGDSMTVSSVRRVEVVLGGMVQCF